MISNKDGHTRDLTIKVVRFIRAPRDVVFDAWVNPQIRRQWWRNSRGEGPTTCDIDARLNGAYCIKQIGGGSEKDTEKEGADYEWIMHGVFVEFDRPKRLAFTWNVNHLYEPCVEQLVTVEFDEVRDGTEITLTHVRIQTEHLRDGTLGGWTKLLEIMADLLES